MMKKIRLACGVLCAGVPLACAQTKTGIIYEIPLEEMVANSDPGTWDAATHSITYTDGDISIGDIDSAYPVGIGLWFGLEDGDGNILATCIVGPQPTAEFTVVSKDLDSNNTSQFAEPMTRVDVPFSVSVTISTVSDDDYLQTLAIAQINNDFYSEEQLLQYPNASKCMMFTRTLSTDENTAVDDELIDRIYTYGDGDIQLKDIDNANYDPALDNSVLTVSSGFMPIDSQATVITSAETDARTVPETTTIEGREFFTPHVVTNLNWAVDNNGVPLAKEAINFSADDFTEGDGVAIRVLPTAWSMFPRDGGGNLIGGETYYTLPSIKWSAKDLYPRSNNQIALFVGTDISGTPFATSLDHPVTAEEEVQDMDVFWDLALDPDVEANDGVTYTAVLRTKTPIDFDGDGSLADEGWEDVDSVSFFYNREINVNGVIVTGE